MYIVLAFLVGMAIFTGVVFLICRWIFQLSARMMGRPTDLKGFLASVRRSHEAQAAIETAALKAAGSRTSGTFDSTREK